MATVKVGQNAPEFRLTADDGREVSLSDYRDQRVVLWFFVKANTPG